MIIKISNIARVKTQIYADAREMESRTSRYGETFIFSRFDFTIFQMLMEQHTFVREHITVFTERCEDLSSSFRTFFSSRFAIALHGSGIFPRSPTPWFLERRLRRKVYAKYLRIFWDSWYVFGTSYISNMDTLFSLLHEESFETRTSSNEA